MRTHTQGFSVHEILLVWGVGSRLGQKNITMMPLCCCALLWNSGRTQQMQMENLVKHTLSGTLGKLHVQKYPWGVIVGHLRSHQALVLDEVGVRWASHHLEFELLKEKKKKRKEQERSYVKSWWISFSHIVQISSAAERENTVWKLTSDGGPESGGSNSAPILSWWNTILLTGQFQ